MNDDYKSDYEDATEYHYYYSNNSGSDSHEPRGSPPPDDVASGDIGDWHQRARLWVLKTLTGKNKIALGIGITLLLAASGYMSGFISILLNDGIAAISGLPVWRYYFEAFFTINGLLGTVILSAVIALALFIIVKKNKDLDKIKETDDRGVDYSTDGTYGTAGWMGEKEALENFEVCHIEKARGTILGQMTTDGERVVALPENTQRNRNILILGSPGTGKSFCYVRNAIFQSIIRNESVVITDPKGELYQNTSEILRQKGYKVQVFNLVDPERSDAWDCVYEIIDPYTGEASDYRIKEFVNTVMKNTCEGPDDHFWGQGEENLFTAIISFVAWHREFSLKTIYEHQGMVLLSKVRDRMSESDVELMITTLEANGRTYKINEKRRAIELLYKLSLLEDGEDPSPDKTAEYMAKIEKEAPVCNISAVYHMLVSNDMNGLENRFSRVPASHPAGIAWSIFKNGADNVRPGFIQGLSQRLQLFQMEDIRRITINEGINLASLGSEKTALFCIISDKGSAMKALTSLFFTFLFRDLAEAADRDGPESRLWVNVICDEFANLGVIPDFSKTISTVRSRRINISIILQNIMQLEANYEEAAQTIISCCDTFLFLGCNDIETAQFMSDISGTASIRVKSARDTRNTSIGNRTVMQGYALNEGDGKRFLLNPDEVRRLGREDVIIYHNGCNILKAKRCGYIVHPFFKAGLPPDVMLKDYPLTRHRYPNTDQLDVFFQEDLANLAQRNKSIVQNHSLDKHVLNAKTPAVEIPLEDLTSNKKSFNF